LTRQSKQVTEHQRFESGRGRSIRPKDVTEAKHRFGLPPLLPLRTDGPIVQLITITDDRLALPN